MLGWLRASRNSARAGAGAGAGGAGRTVLARASGAHRPRSLATDAAAAAAASAPGAAGAFVPPPLPEHKFDPRVIAGVDMGKYYSPKPSTGAAALKLHGLGTPSPFVAEKPKSSNPWINPTALSEPTMPASFPAWTPKSVRTGVLGQKMGMTAVWDGWGNRLPITIIRLEDCQVTQVKDQLSKKGTVGMQVGAGLKKFKHTPKSAIVHYLKAGVMPKKKCAEFPVTVDAVLPLGTTISARHFVPGQTLDIAGTTKGKGFQGAMYRWGFSGQPATHGVSLTHRSIGSVGSNQSPGRVLKGKKMAGRMGNERRTAENLRLHKVDVKRNLLYVQGAVPGNVLGWLEVRDSRKHKWDAKAPPPFPTYFPKAGVAEPDEIVAPTAGVDPNAELAGL